MNPYDPADTALESPKEAPTLEKANLREPSSRWLRHFTVVTALFIVGMYLLSGPDITIDYTRKIPLWEIVDYHLRNQSFTNYRFWWQACFTPLALTGLFVFMISRSRKTRCIAIWVNVSLPVLAFGSGYSILLPAVFAVIGPFILLLAAAGQADGEDWSDFAVRCGSLGSWTALWLVVAFAKFLKIVKSSKKFRAFRKPPGNYQTTRTEPQPPRHYDRSGGDDTVENL
jgi:hypothetical protein